MTPIARGWKLQVSESTEGGAPDHDSAAPGGVFVGEAAAALYDLYGWSCCGAQ